MWPPLFINYIDLYGVALFVLLSCNENSSGELQLTRVWTFEAGPSNMHYLPVQVFLYSWNLCSHLPLGPWNLGSWQKTSMTGAPQWLDHNIFSLLIFFLLCKGAMICYLEGELLVCDCGSSIFFAPPLLHTAKNTGPLLTYVKKLAPHFGSEKKFVPPK